MDLPRAVVLAPVGRPGLVLIPPRAQLLVRWPILSLAVLAAVHGGLHGLARGAACALEQLNVFLCEGGRREKR